jgi:AraC-like DNA-binding protein
LKTKKQGFEGERVLELSKAQQHQIANKETLVFSKIGFFPKAKYQSDENLMGNPHFILVYCIKGYGKAKIKHIEYEIRAGEFFFIPKNTPYFYQASLSNPWTIYWFEFDGHTANAMLQLFFTHTKSHKGYLAYNPERIQLFDVVYKNLKRGYSKDILLLLNMSLLHFLSSFIFSIRIKAKQKDKHQEITNAAIDFMNKNLYKSLALKTIVQHVNVSVPHFSSLFKSKTGISPLDYFNQLKMQRACEYLEYTDMLVKEIAFKMGIEDAQYFSRVFSRVMGMSPNAYRKSKYKA